MHCLQLKVLISDSGNLSIVDSCILSIVESGNGSIVDSCNVSFIDSCNVSIAILVLCSLLRVQCVHC